MSDSHKQNPPQLVQCPQCTSMHCGPVACRFSGLQHDEHRRIVKRISKACAAARTVHGTGASISIKIDAAKREQYIYVAERMPGPMPPEGEHVVRISFEQHRRYTLMTFKTVETK